jgi:hypothetical protein
MNRKEGGPEETINVDNGNGDRGTYTGNLKDSKRDGRGKMKYENGSVYNGKWYIDQKWGEGEMKYKNGDVYNGEWFQDKKNGRQGEMKYKNGDVYNGNWYDDERRIGKTHKKEISESYKTAIDYTYYTVQKPCDLIIGKTYLLYSPKDKKREIAVFKENRVHLDIRRSIYDANDDEEYVIRFNDYIFDPVAGSNIDKIIINGKPLMEEYDEENRTIKYFENIDLMNLKFDEINQVLLFKDENPFYNRESKKIPTGPYKETLDYMYQVRGGKTNKRKKKVRARGKKRKTQRK